MRLIRWTRTAIALGSVVSSAVAWPFAPDEVPIHWDWMGRPDGWAPAWLGLWLLPVVALAVPALVSRRTRGELGPGSLRAMESLLAATTLMLVSIHAAMIEATFSPPEHLLRMSVVTLGLAGVSIVLGLTLPQTEPNRWIGVRTTATRASDAVWKVAHRVAGRAYLAAGVACLVATLALPAHVALVASIGALVIATLAATAWAWLLGRARG